MTDLNSGKGEQRPLCIEDMKNLYTQIVEGEQRDRERMFEWGREQQEKREADPVRYDAEIGASLEIFGRCPEPLNPVITSPKLYKRWQERTEEIIASGEPWKPPASWSA